MLGFSKAVENPCTQQDPASACFEVLSRANAETADEVAGWERQAMKQRL
jgi:hypothetical protein